MNIQEECYQLREETLALANKVQALKKHDFFDSDEHATDDVSRSLEFERRNEMQANIQLAYRHLEDARMRLGKTVQAFDGGASAYPR